DSRNRWSLSCWRFSADFTLLASTTRRTLGIGRSDTNEQSPLGGIYSLPAGGGMFSHPAEPGASSAAKDHSASFCLSPFGHSECFCYFLLLLQLARDRKSFLNALQYQREKLCQYAHASLAE